MLRFSRALKINFVLALLITLLSSFAFAQAKGPFVFSTYEPQEMTILNQGVEALQRRLDLIAAAQKTIEAEYFIYALDEAGRLFSQALIKKAQEGVKVRLLIDYGIPIAKLDPFFAAKLSEAGIVIRYYNPSLSFELFKGQFRSHRKTLIVDDSAGMTGGRNIADEYFDLNADFNFLDRDVLVKGTMAKAMRESFDIFWQSDLTEFPKFGTEPKKSDYGLSGDEGLDFLDSHDSAHYRQDHLYYEYRMKQATAYVTESARDRQVLAYLREQAQQHVSPSRICNDSTFVADLPSLNDKSPEVYQQIKHELLDANKNIVVESPYFILENGGVLFLEGILAKGTKVSVYTNSLNSTDLAYTAAGFYSRIGPLVRRGLDVYIYRGHSLKNEKYYSGKIQNTRWGTHAKTAVIDGKTILVGTFNADPRSTSINAEMAIFCRNSPELAQDILQDMEIRQSNSVKIGTDNRPVDGSSRFANAPMGKIMLYFLFSPITDLFASLM